MNMARRILVIDDSPTLRKVIVFYLSRLGYEVKESSNGRSGLETMESSHFDLLILDMNMPVMNGSQVLEQLAQEKKFETPILILSADKEDQSIANGIHMGASYYMTKPFKPEELVQKINLIFAETDK